MELAHSALGVTSELRFEIDQIIAQDDHAIACNGTWIGRAAEGEGEVTLPMALLMSVKDERIAAFELYDLDAAEAIRARFDQLSLAALRPYHRFDRLYNERRLDEIPALYTDDYVMIDRRSMAWEEIHGGQALVETCRSFLDSAPDLRSVCAVLEEDESGEVVLLRNTFTGQGYTAGGAATGPVELVFIEVGVQRGEQICRTELFDPVDEPVARARYDELRAERAATPGARAAFEFDRLFNAKRFDELRDLYTEDFVMLDHRQLGWEERRGQEVMIDHIRSTLAISPEERSRCEPIADDGGDVVIYRDRFSGEGHGGAGPWELVLDLVIVVRDGKVARIESFDPADEEARTARFDELRDPRPLPGRLYVAMCDAFNERDLDRAISLHQPDTVMRDHRRMPWEPTDTVAELAEVWRAVAESVTDARYQPDFHVVTDEHACVTLRVEAQPDYGGGPAEVVMAVAVGTCDGLMDRHEIYDDPGDALARTGELIGGERGATVTLIARYLQAYRDRDWERMAQLWAPDALLEDHRPAGRGVVEGVDGIVQAIRGLVELAADARTHAREFLELRDGAALYRHEVSGHDATGGAIALEMLIAAKVVDGRFARAEMFALTGESAARRRFAAL
jgi:ketosteroid isomerase-like protein